MCLKVGNVLSCHFVSRSIGTILAIGRDQGIRQSQELIRSYIVNLDQKDQTWILAVTTDGTVDQRLLSTFFLSIGLVLSTLIITLTRNVNQHFNSRSVARTDGTNLVNPQLT